MPAKKETVTKTASKKESKSVPKSVPKKESKKEVPVTKKEVPVVTEAPVVTEVPVTKKKKKSDKKPGLAKPRIKKLLNDEGINADINKALEDLNKKDGVYTNETLDLVAKVFEELYTPKLNKFKEGKSKETPGEWDVTLWIEYVQQLKYRFSGDSVDYSTELFNELAKTMINTGASAALSEGSKTVNVGHVAVSHFLIKNLPDAEPKPAFKTYIKQLFNALKEERPEYGHLKLSDVTAAHMSTVIVNAVTYLIPHIKFYVDSGRSKTINKKSVEFVVEFIRRVA